MDWCESIRGLPQVESSKQLRREPGPRTRWANKRGHPRPAGCLALASRRAHGAGTRSTWSRHLRLRHLRVCRSSGVSVSSAELELRAPRAAAGEAGTTRRGPGAQPARARVPLELRARVAREPGVLRSAGIHRFIDGSWNEIARHICTLKHTRLSAHTAPQEKAREVASHTARCPQYTSRVRRLRRQGSAAAPFCARAFPRRTVHMPRSLEPSQRHKPRPLFLVPRPFGRSPSAGTLMSESLIPHTHRRPPICAHICALLAHAWVPAMIACAARLPMSRTAPRSPHCASPLPGDWGIPTPAQAHPQSTGRTGALSSRRSRRRHSRGPCPPPYPRPASARRT